MPKIIDHPQDTILEEARRQVLGNGYSATTMRSVAQGCGMAVGTLYHYFASKEDLVASILLRHWQQALEAMAREASPDAEQTLSGIYRGLRQFEQTFAPLFADRSAVQASAGVLPQRHAMLRSQIAELIAPCCPGKNPFLAEFTAESLIAWSGENRNFEDIWQVISPLFVPGNRKGE